MKRYIIFLSALTWMCGSFLSHANLLVNGSFEYPDYPMDSHLYDSDAITGWIIVAGDMEITSWYSADGDQNIELEGNGPSGIIEQTFSTAIGTLYAYSFAYSDNPYHHLADTARVDLLDSLNNVIESQVVTGPGANSTSDVQWQTANGSFTATSTETTIRFTALNSNSVGGVGVCIDDVQVIPEPASTQLIALASIGMIAWRRRFN
jgi:hypothetical protein